VLLTKDQIQDFAQYQRLLVGFSGGLDSSVLLHRLVQEKSVRDKIFVIHINHGLSTQANVWQEHCATVCREYNINYAFYTVDFERSCNIEEHARDARYQKIAALMTKNDALLVAHHADDQAETVLLQLFRGAGVDGLAAMPYISDFASGVMLRPLLKKTRAELESYAMTHKISWINDESNQQIEYSRNYLRHHVMPHIRAKWPKMSTNISSCASNLQQAQDNLQYLAQLDCNDLHAATLNCTSLKKLPNARLINVLRQWIKNNQVRMLSTKQLHDLIKTVIYAKQDAQPKLIINNIIIYRYQETLYLQPYLPKQVQYALDWTFFPQEICWHDNRILTAQLSSTGIKIAKGSKIKLTTRVGGEKIRWHGQTKLLKTLLQEWKIPPWQRDNIILMYIDNILAAIVGYAISDEYYGNGYIIIEEKRDLGRLVSNSTRAKCS
jgi:tRNA(Ile)-lysidine synthase